MASFEMTRDAGLARLAAFTPCMGRDYARGRNTDFGPDATQAVSGLSPWIRHRLVTEWEVLAAALDAHGAAAAEGFVQQLFWRSYWKGWLQLRPAEWSAYRRRVAQGVSAMGTNAGLRRGIEDATAGRTGIACFDAWVAELVETGRLHNHARMWFASIWIFTLKLPWVLGADFFLRHLLDADAASNTLSWRWVAGSQTKGKHYVARAENIARHTAGRFDPRGELNEAPQPMVEADAQAAGPLFAPDAPPAREVALLLHEDDLHAESLALGAARVVALAGIAVPRLRSPMPVATAAIRSTEGAVADGVRRASRHFGVAGMVMETDQVVRWAVALGVRDVVKPCVPVGWAGDALEPLAAALEREGIRLHRVRREWDALCWPLATRGYFAFKEKIPALLPLLRP